MQTHAIPTFFTTREVFDSFIKEACGGGLVFLRGAAWSSCYLQLFYLPATRTALSTLPFGNTPNCFFKLLCYVFSLLDFVFL